MTPNSKRKGDQSYTLFIVEHFVSEPFPSNYKTLNGRISANNGPIFKIQNLVRSGEQARSIWSECDGARDDACEMTSRAGAITPFSKLNSVPLRDVIRAIMTQLSMSCDVTNVIKLLVAWLSVAQLDPSNIIMLTEVQIGNNFETK